MVDFADLAADATALAAACTGELVTVVSVDGLTTVADIHAVIDRDVSLETEAGIILRGQTVGSFDKAQLAGLVLVEKTAVQTAAKNYTVRNIQDEDQWSISVVLV